MSRSIVDILEMLKPYNSIIVFALGIILKILLDLNLGIWFIKWFYWFSFRWLFRSKAPKISGCYKQHWIMEDNEHYPNISDRQSLIVLKQLNNYCYGEFTAKNGAEKYYLFGEVIDRKIIGHWANVNSRLDYFGSFELTIKNSRSIEGIWIGHSNTNPLVINQHKWIFRAVTSTDKFLLLLQFRIFLKRKLM